MPRLASVITLAAALIAGALAATPALAASRHVSQRPAYYLALGDSVTAQLSVPLAESLNTTLAGGFQAAGARVADVFTAFDSTDFTTQVTLPVIGTVPQNVANICLWTWECVPPPQGPNEHANATGYAVIAQAFLAADQ